MNSLDRLIAKGRVTPVQKTDGEGKMWIVGYRRHKGSRKAGQVFYLANPIEIKDNKNQLTQDINVAK